MTKLTIAFPNGGIIPASVMGTEKDVNVDAATPIEVPERYGRHLIDDRFAVAAEMPKKEEQKMARMPAEKGSPSRKASADKVAAEKTAAEKAAAEKAAAEKAAAEKAAADRAAAEKAVADAREMLDVVGNDMVAKAAAEDELKAAEAALAGLQG